MMEMNTKSILNYFNLIHTKIKNFGYCLCINRYYKDLVGYPIEFHRYPFNDNWKTIISKSSWMQPHIHFLLVQNVNYKISDIKKTLFEIRKEYLRQVKFDGSFIRRILPVELYRFYKIFKNFIFN